MRTVLFVVAGNVNEFNDWCSKSRKEDRYTGSNFIYVVNSDTLRGQENPDGICIGTWKDREDIYDIIQFLHIAARDIKKQKGISNLSSEVDAYRKKRMRIKAYE